MRERLEALQAERDAKAAEAEAAVAEMARVEELEQEVSRREAEVLSLKKELEASSSSTAQSSVDTDEVRGRVEAITAQLEEAVKAKEALEAELTEVGEYTVSWRHFLLRCERTTRLFLANLKHCTHVFGYKLIEIKVG